MEGSVESLKPAFIVKTVSEMEFNQRDINNSHSTKHSKLIQTEKELHSLQILISSNKLGARVFLKTSLSGDVDCKCRRKKKSSVVKNQSKQTVVVKILLHIN